MSTSRPHELRLVPERTAEREHSNHELVEGLRGGDSWARNELFDRYAALVERTCGGFSAESFISHPCSDHRGEGGHPRPTH